MAATISDGDPHVILMELRDASLRQLLLALIVVTTLPLWILAAFLAVAGLAPLYLSLALALTWIGTRLSLGVGARLTAAVLVAGLKSSVTVAMELYSRSLAGLGFGAIAVVATVLLGPRSGLVHRRSRQCRRPARRDRARAAARPGERRRDPGRRLGRPRARLDVLEVGRQRAALGVGERRSEPRDRRGAPRPAGRIRDQHQSRAAQADPG
jgi:hypothetical protein